MQTDLAKRPLFAARQHATKLVQTGDPSTSEISVGAMRAIVGDLFVPSAAIYWTDFLVSLLIGYSAMFIYAQSSWLTWQQVIAYVIALFALFRVGSFIHEVIHLRHGALPGFRASWDAIFGIPLLMPSHFYLSHRGHHNRHRFGTRDDGEYLPLVAGSWGTLVEFVVQVPLLPLWVILRFLASPLTFFHPKVRQWTLERASSFVINFRSRFEVPRNAPRKQWAAIELTCSALAWALVMALACGFPTLVGINQVYLIAVGVLAFNYVRTFAAHRYRSLGDEMSFLEQLDDSINIEGSPILTELVFPVGLRYHALHHLFPGIPYHNLGIAHRRLMAQLPADAPYRRTVFPTTWAALRTVWNDVRTGEPAEREDVLSHEGQTRVVRTSASEFEVQPVRRVH